MDQTCVYNNTLQTAGAGNCWNLAVLGPLLGERFGLNVTAVQTALDQNATSLAGLADVGRQARPVDLKQLERYLGHYQNGWSTVRDGRELQLLIGPRVIPLKVMPDVRTP